MQLFQYTCFETILNSRAAFLLCLEMPYDISEQHRRAGERAYVQHNILFNIFAKVQLVYFLVKSIFECWLDSTFITFPMPKYHLVMNLV